MSLPTSILLFKGTEPYALFYTMKLFMLNSVDNAFGPELNEPEKKKCFRDASEVFKQMHAQELDDVTVDLPSDIRIKIVDEVPASTSQYENSACNIVYYESGWKVAVLRSQLPRRLKSGHFKCALRIETKYHFWKRPMGDNGKLMNSLMVVPCKLYLIVMERTGDDVAVTTPVSRWRVLCDDFCNAFQI